MQVLRIRRHQTLVDVSPDGGENSRVGLSSTQRGGEFGLTSKSQRCKALAVVPLVLGTEANFAVACCERSRRHAGEEAEAAFQDRYEILAQEILHSHAAEEARPKRSGAAAAQGLPSAGLGT